MALAVPIFAVELDRVLGDRRLVVVGDALQVVARRRFVDRGNEVDMGHVSQALC
jgi:hypothetical protein